MSPTLSAPPASRLRRTRALLLAMLAPALSLVVVFSTPTTAHAFDPGATKVIQGAMKSPPAQIIRWTPAGRALTLGVGLGMLAYETRDMWLPTLKDFLNPEVGLEVEPSGPYDHYAAAANCRGDASLTAKADGSGATAIWTGECGPIRNATGDFKPFWNLQWHSRCHNPETGAISTSLTPMGTTNFQAVEKTYKYGATLFTYPSIQMGSPTAMCSGFGEGWIPYQVVARTTGADIVSIPELIVDLALPDGQVETKTTIRCANPETGDVVGTVTANMTGVEGVNVPSCAAEYPGSIPWDGTISRGPKGNPTTPLGSFDTDPDLFNQWRDCFGPTGVICKTEVYVDGQRCTIGRDVCVIWYRINRGEPDRIECRFGPHSIGTEYCMPLKSAYGPGVKLDTHTTIIRTLDPEVEPEVVTQPEPTPPPNPEPTPPTNPEPTPPAEPRPPDPNPELPPEVTPETTEKNCNADAVSWNPIQWVYIPVKCAIKWAFVPKTSLSTRVSTIKATLDVKAPFSWVAGIGAVPVSVGAGGGCPDWVMHVGDWSKNVVCDSSYVAAIRGARPVLFAFMASLALWPLIRSTAYAAFPIIKPQPGVLR